MRRESKENALDMLRKYDTVIIMDDSASMSQDRRWEQVRITVTALAMRYIERDFERLVRH